jgi:urease accessory protein
MGEPWRAELRLGFERRLDRTVLASRSRQGPLTVQRAFYPEGETAHVYLLHPPGGVVGGDQLHIEARSEPGAHGLITTPAAGKFYRSGGATALQTVDLKVAAGAALEWLPQETILFDGARVDSTLNVDLVEGSRFVGWDLVCFGRPAAGEEFAHGEGRFALRFNKAGSPLLRECFQADAHSLRARWGLRAKPVMAVALAYPFGKEHLPAVRDILDADTDAGATVVEGLLIVRALGLQAEAVRNRLAEVWQVVRPRVMGREVCRPRIWAT